MGLVNLGDRVRELAAPPIFLAMDLALGPLDEGAIPLEHRGHLFTLVRVNQKHDFVVSQSDSPWVESLPTRGEARSKAPIVRFRGWRILLARAGGLNRTHDEPAPSASRGRTHDEPAPSASRGRPR